MGVGENVGGNDVIHHTELEGAEVKSRCYLRHLIMKSLKEQGGN